MTTDDFVRFILEARSFEELQRKLEIEMRKAEEEFQAAQYEWNTDSNGQD